MSSMIRVLTLATTLALIVGCTHRNDARPAHTVSKSLVTTLDVPADTQVSLENLVGQVEVTQGGAQLHISATVVAGGGDQAAAQALADTIKLDVSKSQGQIQVHVDYPVQQHDRYEYLPTHANQAQATKRVFGFEISSSFTSSRSTLSYQGHDVTVYQNQGSGTPLHVDLKVQIPVGARLALVNHVGLIQAQNLRGTLELQTDSGDISTQGTNGALTLKSGSGDTLIVDQHGALAVDTGSGDVTAHQVTGSMDLHTGSGDIEGRDLHGDSLALTTGSGDIDLDQISGMLKLNSGSGDITVNAVSKVGSAQMESGSGDLKLQGDLSGLQSFDLQTGSGDVTLVTSQPPSVHLDITGSDIETHWSGLRNAQSSRRHFSGDVGAATGQGHIRTGSGDVDLKP